MKRFWLNIGLLLISLLFFNQPVYALSCGPIYASKFNSSTGAFFPNLYTLTNNAAASVGTATQNLAAIAQATDTNIYFDNGANTIIRKFTGTATSAFATNWLSWSASSGQGGGSDGDIYYVGADYHLYQVTTAGVVTDKGALVPASGDTIYNTLQYGDIAADNNGRLFWYASINASGASYLYRIDDNTLKATNLGNYGPNAASGVAFDSVGNLVTTAGSPSSVYSMNLTTNISTNLGTVTGFSTGQLVYDLASCNLPSLNPDLAITKTVANITSNQSPASSAYASDVLEYTITVTNNGNLAADTTTLADSIPTGTTYVAGSTTLNGTAVSDVSGKMPYDPTGTGTREIHSAGQAAGVLQVGAGKAAVVKFRVKLNASGLPASVSNAASVNYPHVNGGVTTFVDVISNQADVSTLMDYSDAPASYGLPTHKLTGNLKLGSNAPDGESAQPTPLDGTGDDVTGSDDEDGVTFPTLKQGQAATISATVSGTGGYLQAWIDWNNDGDFADAGEQVATNLQDNGTGDTDSTTGKLAFSVTVPATVPAQTYARFRWSTTSGLSSTAAATDGEVEDYALTIQAGYSLSGKVFEDVNYGGGAGRSYVTAAGVARSAARVELYGSTGNFVSATTTDASGAYSFTGLQPGNYTVRVVNSTVTSSRTGYVASVLAVQTFRTNGLSANVGTEDPNRVGGEKPALVDAASNTTNATLASLTTATKTAQSITPITLAANVTGIDFGFNFDTIVNTNDSGQGSLRQFIANANLLANTGLNQAANSVFDPVAGVETSIFMIPASALNGTGGNLGSAVIKLLSGLSITSADTAVDGRTQTANIGNSNAGTVTPSVTTVGVQNIALPTYQRPEIVIDANTFTAFSILAANNVAIKGLAIYNGVDGVYIEAGTATSPTQVEENFLGSLADGTLLTRLNRGVSIKAGTFYVNLKNNYFAYAITAGASFRAGGTISGNYFFKNGNGSCDDNLSIESSVYGKAIVSGNLFEKSAAIGIEGYGISGGATIENNTITGSGQNGTICDGQLEQAGIRVGGKDNLIRYNILHHNLGVGIIVHQSLLNNTLSQNSTYANGSLGIDLDKLSPLNPIGEGITIDDSNDADTGANNLLNFPIFAQALLAGNNLTLKGCAPTGATIELFEADVSPGGSATAGDNKFGKTQDYGEGERYLGSVVEGVGEDTVTTPVNCATLTSADSNSAVGMSPFQWTMTLPAGVVLGDKLTATSTVSAIGTSEFSAATLIISLDHGDAPVTYGDPTHTIAGTLKLGTNAPDAEITAATPLDGTGDDATDTNDEDGITVFPTLTPGATTYSIPAANISVTGTGTLHAWIDFNKDGAFTSSEYKSVSVTNGTLAGPLSWTGITAGSTGTTYARFRFTTTTLTDTAGTANVDERATMAANDGEVEDYALTIQAASSSVPATSCPAGTIPSAINLFPNGDFAIVPSDDWHTVLNGVNNTTPGHFYADANFYSQARNVGYDTYPADNSFGGAANQFSIINGNFSGWSSQLAFPGDPANNVPATANWFYSNGNVLGSGDASGPLSAEYLLWEQDATNLVVGKTYVFSSYVSNVGETDPPDLPIIRLRVGGTTGMPDGTVVFGPYNLTAAETLNSKPLNGWKRVEYTFTATSPSAKFKFTSAAKGVVGDDFALSVLGVNQCVPISADLGDAPSSYDIGSVASHVIPASPTVYLGSKVPDADSGAVSPLDGTGDDVNGTDDEDGVTLPAMARGQSTSIMATVAGTGGYLQGWIDWNGDGDFADVGEQIATNLQDNGAGDTDNTTGKIAFSVTVPATATTSQIYARFRWSTTQNLTATAAANDGEVEDYAVTVANAVLDYGDAPDSYGSASHTIVAGLYLGSAPDSEAANQASYNAYGDGGDEDGAPRQPVSTYIPLFPTLTLDASSYSVPFTVTNQTGKAALLVGWLDFNKNGTFESTEKTSVAVPVGANLASVTLKWSSIPTDITLGTTALRVRLTTDTTLTSPTGLAVDGEVEDYPIAISQLVPANSPDLAIKTNASPEACEKVVFADDFNDLTDGTLWGKNRAGSQAIRNWVRDGGGNDSYAQVTSVGSGNNAIYFGNGAIREINPPLSGSLSFDANGKLLTVINSLALRDDMDDLTPGTSLASGISESDWGPLPVTLARTFTTVPGKVYRLYFKALPEAGSFLPGIMRLDAPGGSIHFKAPGSGTSAQNYAVDFTASSTSSTITFVNYGHIDRSQAGWCDLTTDAWCTVGGTAAGQHTNELILDDVKLTESTCGLASDYGDAPASYGTPAHAADANLFIGATAADTESAAMPSTNADGDDASGTADEDGIASFPVLTTASTSYQLNVKVTNKSGQKAWLVGWIDFNGNGAFDSNEAATVSVITGTNNKAVGLTWKNLSGLAGGTTYARLRLTTDASIATGKASTSQADGAANDGEVEDYALTISESGYTMSGKVFHDSNVNGTDDNESGLKNVTVVLYDKAQQSCVSVHTGADGSYAFSGVPAAAANNYVLYEAAAETIPTPGTCPPAANDPNGYVSSTANTVTVSVTNADVIGVDFGDIAKPSFLLEHTQAILPDTSVVYPHVFESKADGSVIFSVVQEDAEPADLTWGQSLWLDTQCDGKLDAADTALTSALAVQAGDKLCVLAKVVSPAQASTGAAYTLTLQSEFVYGDDNSGLANDIQTRTDITKTSAGTEQQPVDGTGKLSLEKSVWNVTRNMDGEVAKPGETLRYTIHYENIGDGTLQELDVHDSVPAFTTLVTGSAKCLTTPTALGQCTPVISADSLEWTFTGSLPAGASGDVAYEVVVQ